MQRMWRQMFAAVAGVVVIAGAAAAQSPPPQPLPPIIPVAAPTIVVGSPTQAIPVFMPTRGDTPGAVQNAIPQANQPVVVISHGSKGCGTGCGSSGTSYSTGCETPLNPCANGCGSLKQDCNFMFGSCKSFFSPCGVGGGGCNGCGGSGTHRFGGGGGCGGHGHGNCPVPPWGTPYNQGGWTHCHYDSFLNH